MKTKNRLTEFYGTQHLVPFDEVEQLRDDAFREGYQIGMAGWWFVLFLGGCIGGLIVAVIS